MEFESSHDEAEGGSSASPSIASSHAYLDEGTHDRELGVVSEHVDWFPLQGTHAIPFASAR